MALVAAKCTQCGGNIEVDDQKDAAICPFCGTPYIVEQAINNYNITNNNHIHANVVNIVNQNGEGDTADSLYKTCLECCKKGLYAEMASTYAKFEQKYPTDYRVYYIKLLEETNCFYAVSNSVEECQEKIRVAQQAYDKMLQCTERKDIPSDILQKYENYITGLNTRSRAITEAINKKQNEERERREKEYQRNAERIQKKKRIKALIIVALIILIIVFFRLFYINISFTNGAGDKDIIYAFIDMIWIYLLIKTIKTEIK